jgi:hypothetical protein
MAKEDCNGKVSLEGDGTSEVEHCNDQASAQPSTLEKQAEKLQDLVLEEPTGIYLIPFLFDF